MAHYFENGRIDKEFRFDAMTVLEHTYSLEVDDMCDAIQTELGIEDKDRDKVEEFVMEQISLAVRAS